MIEFRRNQALAYRLRVNHLTGRRLPRGALVSAARSGLQDGSPRSGLLSLAARVDGVAADDWRGNGLAQVFGPRGAVYVVPHEDVGVFTLGLLPRASERVAVIEKAADGALEVLAGKPMRQADLVAALPDIGGTRGLRWASTMGTLVPSWDTVDTIVHPAPAPTLDPETARLELARRFFRYLGPATVKDLQWWLDGLRSDAAATVEGLADELVAVAVDGVEHLALAEAVVAGDDSEPDAELVLLLPPDDVYINRLNGSLLVPDPARRKLLWPQAPPPGALIIGGEVRGTWRRRHRSVVISPWDEIAPRQRLQAETIAAEWPLDNDADPDVSWIAGS